ncbi:MAG: ATP-dependent zinc metalloprotease FtsH [Ktedonobacterales bacterium]
MEPRRPSTVSPWPPPNSPAGSRHFRLILVLVLLSLTMATLLAVVNRRLSTHPAQAGYQIGINQVSTLAFQPRVAAAIHQGRQSAATAIDGGVYGSSKENTQRLTLVRMGYSVTHTSTPPPIATPLWPQSAQSALPLVILAGGLVMLALVVRRRLPADSLNQARVFGRSRAARFDASHPTVLFRDVAGVEEAKEELQEVVHFLRHPAIFARMGAHLPKGVLLIGPPGTGKTLIARAVAGEAGVAFFSVSGSEFVEMYVGVGASRVRDLFTKAKAVAPCIIFIDEIDAIGRTRNASGNTGNDELEHTLNQLLVEMDGFDTQHNVVVIAATNRPDMLDPALLRPGRFDRRVMLDNPDVAGRLAILQVHSVDKPLSSSVNLNHLAEQTTGFSGADLANLMNEAALLAVRRGHERISQQDLEESILRVVAGPERKSHVLSEAEKAIVAYHETGHAIVMRLLPGFDVVRKLSTVSRGAALGMTVAAPTEDRSLLRRTELLAKLAGLMGGRAAEEIVMGDITTGAAQDIKQATIIAHRMVREFGMSPLGNLLIDTDGVSPQLAAQVDDEVASLVDDAYRTAKSILLQRRKELVSIAEHLVRVETIDGADLDAMLFIDQGTPQEHGDEATTTDTRMPFARSVDAPSEGTRKHREA